MANETRKNAMTKVDADGDEIAVIGKPRLPYHPAIEERFGISKAAWKALVEAIFPNATSTESVILALSYCRARNLDPFKRNVHIVPIYSSDKGCMVDTIWPGIGELRTTAFRTGEYAGRGETVFGPDIERPVGKITLTFPEWAQVTVRRLVKGHVVEFVGPRVYWIETYAVTSRNDDTPNTMWRDRPRGQLEKCAEAAALRAAFPEEIGTDYIPEEIQHGRQPMTLEGTVDKPRTIEGLMAADQARTNGFQDHVGHFPSDEQLADADESRHAQQAEAEAPAEDTPEEAYDWRADKDLPEGAYSKLEHAVSPEAVEAARVELLPRCETAEQLEALSDAAKARTEEIEASRNQAKGKGGKKQGNLV